MNVLLLLLSTALIIIFLVFYFKKLKNRFVKNPKLFSGEGAIYVKSTKNFPAISEEEKKEFEEIIKSSKELSDLFYADGKNSQFYGAILQNKELLAKLKNSSTKEEAKSILEQYFKTQKQPPKQIQTKQESKIKQPKSAAKSEKPKLIKQPLTNQSKYLELYSAIEERNIERFLSAVKILSDETLEKMFSDYEKVRLLEGFPYKKLDLVFRKVKSRQELIDVVKKDFVNYLNARLDDIKQKTSMLRKKGKETKHEELLLMMVTSKIKIFESTFAKKDFEKVNEMLNQLEESIKQKSQTNS